VSNDIAGWYQRLADNNAITPQQARQLLKADELAEFHWDVKDYIKHGRQNALDGAWVKQLENASARQHITQLEALNTRIQHQVENLYATHLTGTSELLRDIYSDSFYRNAYEIQKGLGLGFGVSGKTARELDTLMQTPWAADGANFSERIWGMRRPELVQSLQTEMSQSLIKGSSPKQAIDNISKQFGVSKSKAGTLVNTESAYFDSYATKDCFEELNVKKYKIAATLDKDTSKICRTLDGRVVDVADFEPGVTAHPFHANCRTVETPWFEDNLPGERIARGDNGVTYNVPANTTYEQWQALQEKLKTPPKAVELKSVQAVTKQLNSMHYAPGKSAFNLDGITLDASRGVYDSFDQIYTAFPDLYRLDVFKGMDVQDLNEAYFAQSGSKHITLNGKLFSKPGFIKSYNDEISAGFSPKGTDWKAIFAHEYGYLVDDYLGGVSSEVRDGVLDALREDKLAIYSGLSENAAKSSSAFFADAFAEYVNSPKPRPIAKEFGKQLGELLKKRKI
jgi:SPP1 gp7 family putative phage head morphogenesis protein